MIFITLPSRIIRPHEVEANASKLVGVLTIYKIVFIYIYIYIYIYIVHLLVWIIHCTRCTVHTSK